MIRAQNIRLNGCQYNLGRTLLHGFEGPVKQLLKFIFKFEDSESFAHGSNRQCLPSTG
tara:strand:+ start:3040 stop:3213 length:174 start_codon:yes stop_codon:yes gene_type:complete